MKKVTAQNSQIIANNFSKGFTLIELLVVIGVLGIMAGALVATIDPVEQIRKAQDSNVKNAAVEYLNAMVRYYATHQYYPWDTNSAANTTCKNLAASNILSSAKQVYVSPIAGMNECTQALLDEKELKTGFISDINNITSKIYVSQEVETSDITVCFLPSSKSQKVDPNTKFDNSGVEKTSGSCTLNSTDCYWCAK